LGLLCSPLKTLYTLELEEHSVWVRARNKSCLKLELMAVCVCVCVSVFLRAPVGCQAVRSGSQLTSRGSSELPELPGFPELPNFHLKGPSTFAG